MKPREAAYLALCASSKGAFITDFLKDWQKNSSPSQQDYHLAQEIAYGTERMRMALDYLAVKGSERKKLSLKANERILLRTAIYQMVFMDRIPSYAIVNESVAIARKYCHKVFASFLNAVLRKMTTIKLELPQGTSLDSLSIRYSYPEFFVQELIKDHGIDPALKILEAGNLPAPIVARVRNLDGLEAYGISEANFIKGLSTPYAIIDGSLVAKLADNPSVYIQNVTPGALIEHLGSGFTQPSQILDLCASPGGKLLLAHDRYPQAVLYGNDVSEEKIKTLQQNLDKYGVKAQLSCSPGEEYEAARQFDLIILDVPCSNTGVLNKRPEARWRLSEEGLARLEETQLKLIKRAAELLSADGEIWYMTCSILKRENEGLIAKACERFHLKPRTQMTFLPNLEGCDGGFGCALTLSKNL